MAEREPFVVEVPAAIFHLHERTAWQGYWSDPSRASAELGKDLVK